MKKINFTCKLSIWFLLLMSSFVCNSETFSHQDIERLALSHLETKYQVQDENKHKISISKPKLDPRVQINECASKLTVNILENHNSRNINVKISCDFPNQWQIYLPVKIKKLLPVVVAVENLNKGSILDTSNTAVQYIAEHKIRGAVLSSNEKILGAKLKRNLQKGKAVYANQLCIVCKGDKVNLIAGNDDFQIKTDGIALTNGTIGEQVTVKNARSGKIISGRVNSLNNVVILL